MKQVNIFIVLAFLLFCISGFSQDTDDAEDAEDNPVSKGTIFLSGQSRFSAGLNEIDDPSFNSSSYSISPTIGYFLIDNLVVGAEVSFSGFKNTRDGSSELESRGRGISFSPFARYYFNTGKIKPYVSGSVGFGSNRSRNEGIIVVNDVTDSFETDSKGRGTIYKATGGVALFLTKDISIDVGIQYNNSTFKRVIDGGIESRNTNNGINLIGGISIYL
jgi:outer membrane protein